MKNKILLYIILFIIFIFLIKYFNNYYINYILDKYTNKTDTFWVSDTIRHVDTLAIFKEKLVPKEVYLTRVDTFYTKDGNDTIFKTESKLYQDTLCQKQDSIILKSYISGINSKIDSIKADWRKSETIITNTEIITKYITRKKRFIDHFKIGVGVGYGLGLKNKDFEPFVGFSLNYNF